MAATEAQIESGHRLAGDLRSIRRKRGVDLKEILDTTRLAEDVIEQLEETGLINHPAFNQVYLRSLFAAYGGVLEIQRDHMMSALEEMFQGQYVGSLAVQYLGESAAKPAPKGDETEPIESAAPEVVEEEVEPPESGSTESKPTQSEDDSPLEADAAAKDASAVSETESVVDPDTEPVEPAEESSEDASDAIQSEEESEAAAPTQPSAPAIAQPWRTESAASDASQSSGSFLAKGSVLLPNMSGMALVVVAAIALIALLWFAVGRVMNMGGDEQVPVVAEDTTQVREIVLPDPVQLADSIRIDVIAVDEPLDPIRVTVDRDLRKPYWIEMGDTMRFAGLDRIRLEREVEHTRVLVQGYVLPQAWMVEGQVVDLSRTRIQAWFDSLAFAGAFPPLAESTP